ncbi:MAG: FprA family A-type flavoprotein [Firmicutes bacterium]|jgi:flavorubredoxin|nr:FprA family A-type flavoprotein [Bacillota bacterium]
MEVRQGIHWVGVFDPDLEIFDIVIPTQWGTTYNAYLIDADEPALVDTVKGNFTEEFLEKLEARIDLGELKHLIVNHTEPDHSGAAPELLRRAPHLKVHGSRAAIQFLREQVNSDFDAHVVGDNDVLDLGSRRLRFIMAPFLHWPDTMFTYLEGEGVLFTCDAFGSHYSPPHGKLFESEQLEDITEATKYYFDSIMSPFKPKIREAVAKIAPLEIELIATGHGPILDKDPWRIVDLYRSWSSEPQAKVKKVIIGYASAYGHTKKMAELIAQGVEEVGNVEMALVDVAVAPERHLEELFSDFDALIIGSPTINANVVAPVWRALDRVSAITARGKAAAVFGNYGWSGEAVELLEERLEKMRLVVSHPPVKVRFGLTPADEERCLNLGRFMAQGLQ